MFGTATLLNGQKHQGGSVDGGGDCLTIVIVNRDDLGSSGSPPFPHHLRFWTSNDVSQRASRSVVRLFRWDWRPPQKESGLGCRYGFCKSF